MSQNRFRSLVVWTTVIAQVLSMALALGLIDIGLSEQINQVAAAGLQLLVVLGVLNNPTDATGF